MKVRIIWWIQLLINCFFFLQVVQWLEGYFVLEGGLDFVVDILLIILAIILGYALTVKFENDPEK
ncbi:hypothetical protein LFYK43_00390 [Ligilactobacillus salitolerans]|uniref:Uncharacterized protein n=1 Tax=Ligilactobacillus salitolerans TaxID=1808352 RepID=A0A401IPZ5_9LACO|nr:hypothetical protein [Ligilactobacillus salitolerans]GBG93580.1 hypothetical protein LFYK43_00390 [Ligilactobacillus salitolerans]